MKIAIFGSGGVGGYFGGRLAASGQDVTFLARGAHLLALQQHGLRITSPLGDAHVAKVQATDRPQAIGPVDVVLLTTKLYDTDAAAATLAPLIGPNTVVITLQNGVDAVDMVAAHVGRQHVAGGVAYIVAVIQEPGHIRHTTAQQLVFGEMDGRRSDRLVAFEQACIKAGFQAKASENIQADLWTKFVRLATWSGMTSVTRSPMGVVREMAIPRAGRLGFGTRLTLNVVPPTLAASYGARTPLGASVFVRWRTSRMRMAADPMAGHMHH